MTKWTTCSPCSRRAGLTLIEVVAAIVILGTILVGVVLSKSKHVRQIATTRRKLDAVRAADAMLSNWWTDSGGIPVGRVGIVPGDESLSWRTYEVPCAPLADLSARTVRFEVCDEKAALVTVDLVLNLPKEDVDAADEEGGTP